MSSILLGKAIYSILTGNTELHEYIDDKIYPIFAPDEILVPFLVYERRNIVPSYTKDGLLYDEVGITINIVSADYSDGIEIANIVRSALELKSGDYSGVHIYRTELINSSEDYGVDGFIQTIDFTFKCK